MVNYSGGAKGSDIGWEVIGKIYGVNTIAFSFEGHSSLSPNRTIITDDELQEGWEMALVAADKMKRYLGRTKPYIRKLISRNWFQVKNSDAIFAIGKIVQPGEYGNRYKNESNLSVVDGGTGYAVMMSILTDKPTYVFEQYENKWFKWENDNFIETTEPKLTENFAGIGTRELNENGMNAIKSIYKNTFL